jgi:hypothetical protein
MSHASFRRSFATGVCALVLALPGCSSPTAGRCCTVTGVVKRTTGQPIPGVDVWVSPDGGYSSYGTTSATGNYSVFVLGSTGLVQLNNVPTQCRFPDPVPYHTGPRVSIRVDFSLTCSS